MTPPSWTLKPKPRKGFPWLRIILVLCLVFVLFWGGFAVYLASEVKHRFESRRWSVPSRVFSATVVLYPGQALAPDILKVLLEERRYVEATREPLRAGEYKTGRDSLTMHLREFRFPGRSLQAQRVQVDFQGNRIARMRGAKGDMVFLELEPLEVARLFGSEREGRLLISIHQVPRYLTDAVVSIEDHRFFEHGGMDWWGILRALFTDIRARRVVQGGSTITQQLVKNYFLESERRLKRKLLEVYMAVIIEAMYEKDDILEMYLNEIYMGQRGGVAIHGMGEAARYIFGRNVEDLTLAEAATLAGIIRAPNNYSPTSRPDACIERRNTVLRRMLDLGKISASEYEAARIEPLRVPTAAFPVNIAPFFVDYVRQQLQELYASEVLETEGLTIYTTLHPEMALAAETALREGLQELDREREGHQSGAREPLEGVLIAIQPKTGAVMALVGGRDYGQSQFNRALHARRQPGSAVKPFVYLTALDGCSLVSPLSDEPKAYTVEGMPWLPRNFDGRYRGRVMFREALEESLNAATVDLAMSVGLDKIVTTLRSVGITSPLSPVPSLALGAFEVTPLELAGAYAALNNDGQKPYLLGLKEVVTEKGELLERRHVDLVSVTSPAKSFLVTHLLQGVMERGTGKGLRRLGIEFPCAGKTGTTSDFRDSWFVGYTTDLLVLVWVGYDDNQSTSFTGAQGAGRIWARFMNGVRPWFNAQPFRIPPGVVQRILCGESRALATVRCTDKRLEYFLAEGAPKEYCPVHSGD